MIDMLSKINDPETEKAVLAERTFMSLLEGNCKVPIGAYAYIREDELFLSVVAGNAESGKSVKRSSSGNTESWEAVAGEMADAIKTEAASKGISLYS
jgi:hydroxymethylbilane synthase